MLGVIQKVLGTASCKENSVHASASALKTSLKSHGRQEVSSQNIAVQHFLNQLLQDSDFQDEDSI